MKKTISIIVASIIVFTAIVSFGPVSVYAQASTYFDSVSFDVLPADSSIINGHLNSTNTGFRVDTITKESFKPYQMSLYLDSSLVPLDIEKFDNSTNYSFSSNTATEGELQVLASEGLHTWAIKASDTDGGVEYEVADGSFSCDYTAPLGDFFANAKLFADPDQLKVGDTVAVGLTQISPTNDIESVNAKLYGRELSFVKAGSQFYADYVVMEGDHDQTLNLPLTDVEYRDASGNIVSMSNLDVPIDFSIDANSPEVRIISPENKEYNSRDITISYIATEGSLVSVFLDGEVIPMANGGVLLSAQEGDHNLQVVAVDEAGNRSVAIANFKVKTVVSTVIATTGSDASVKPLAPKQHSSIKVASRSVQVSAVESGENPVNNSELAREGRISSATDYQPRASTNWTAWLILIGLLVLAAAVGTTSYYGFAWLSLSKKPTVLVEQVNQINSEDESITTQSEQDDRDDIDKPNHPPENYTRW